MKKILIVLGSGDDVNRDVTHIRSRINSRRSYFLRSGLDIEVISREDYTLEDSAAIEALAEKLTEQDTVIFLFFRETDDLTDLLFDRTLAQLQQGGRMKLLIYFKDTDSALPRTAPVEALERRMESLRHYPDHYTHSDTVFSEIMGMLDETCLTFREGKCYCCGTELEDFSPDNIDAFRNNPNIRELGSRLTELREDIESLQTLLAIKQLSKSGDYRQLETRLDAKQQREQEIVQKLDGQYEEILSLMRRFTQEIQKRDSHSRAYRRAKEYLRLGMVEECRELMSAENITERRQQRNRQANLSDIEEHKLGVHTELIVRSGIIDSMADEQERERWRVADLIDGETAASVVGAIGQLQPYDACSPEELTVLDHIKRHYFEIFTICLNDMEPAELLRQLMDAMPVFHDAYHRTQTHSSASAPDIERMLILRDLRLFSPVSIRNFAVCLTAALHETLRLRDGDAAEELWNSAELCTLRCHIDQLSLRFLMQDIDNTLEAMPEVECVHAMLLCLRQDFDAMTPPLHDDVYCDVLIYLAFTYVKQGEIDSSVQCYLDAIACCDAMLSQAEGDTADRLFERKTETILRLVFALSRFKLRQDADRWLAQFERLCKAAVKQAEAERDRRVAAGDDPTDANRRLNNLLTDYAQKCNHFAKNCAGLSPKIRLGYFKKAAKLVNACEYPDADTRFAVTEYNNNYSFMLLHPDGNGYSATSAKAGRQALPYIKKAADTATALLREGYSHCKPPLAAQALYSAYEACKVLNDYPSALSYMLERCDIFERLLNKYYYTYIRSYAEALRMAGECYGKLGENDKAAEYIEKSREIFYRLWRPAENEEQTQLKELYTIELINTGCAFLFIDSDEGRRQAIDCWEECARLALSIEPYREFAPLAAFAYSNIYKVNKEPAYREKALELAEVDPNAEASRIAVEQVQSASKEN